MKTPVRILIIENQTLVRIGIRTVLSENAEFEVVGEAVSGAEGFGLFQALNPDVTILEQISDI